MRTTVTFFGGKEYKHSEYTTPTKQKALPEEVKIAILGKAYIAPAEPDPTEPEVLAE